MTEIDALTRVHLDIERDTTTGELVNLIQNPDGSLGGWGWVTPVAGSSAIADARGLGYLGVASVANWFTSELYSVTAGQYVAASWTNVFVVNSGLARARLVWYDANDAVVSSGTQGAYQTAAGDYTIAATVVPAGVTQVALRFDVYSTTAGANPTSTTKNLVLNNITMATSANSGDLIASRTNLLTNPSFETNTTGWTNTSASSGTAGVNNTIARVTSPAGQSGTACLSITSSAAGDSYVSLTNGTANWVPVVAGKDYNLSVSARSASAARRVTIGFWWYASDGSYVTFSVTANIVTTTTSWQQVSVIATAPFGAAYGRPWARFESTATSEVHYVDAALVEQTSTAGAYFDGATAAGGGWTYAWSGAANASTSVATSTTGLGVLPPAYYVNIIGDSASINIDRQELNLSTLTATVVNASLDPAVSTLLRPDRRCRVLVDKTGSGGWEPIFTGKTLKAAVEYHLLEDDPDRRAVITLTAVDPLTRLAQESRPGGVATIAQLPYVLEGCGVPWNVNGSGNQVPSATIVASNDQASVVDQIAVTRDTNGGYAWVDRKGVVQVWDGASISSTVKDTLNESAYAANGFSISYATDRIINSVSVDSYEVNPATGETGIANYGPFRASGLKPNATIYDKTITVQGLTSAQITTLANAILTANATPVRRIDSVTIPLTLATISRALLDHYDLVTVSNTRAGLSANMRIVGVVHTITASQSGTKWLMRLDFNTDDSIAAPQIIPAPAAGSGANASGYTNLTHAGTAGTISYAVVGGYVYVRFNVNFTSTAAGATFNAVSAANGLPAALRPSTIAAVGVVAAGGASTVTVRADVNTNGSINLMPLTGSTTGAAGYVVFPAGL